MRVNQWQVDTDRPGRDGDVPVIEDELIVRATAGDVRARTCLLAAVRPLALRYGRACLRRRDEALCSPEDIAQEVCIAIMGALPTYRPERGSFHGLVRTIAQHKAVDAYRAAHRDRCSPTADPPDTHVDVEGPEHRVLSAERQEYFGRLLATLPAWQRQVIELRVVVGLSAEETAQMVGGTAGAVRVTQHRVLKYLRRRLEADAARPEVSPVGRASRAS
jgi:RNA polymerase sigma-70 factor (ECF subfamily)